MIIPSWFFACFFKIFSAPKIRDWLIEKYFLKLKKRYNFHFIEDFNPNSDVGYKLGDEFILLDVCVYPNGIVRLNDGSFLMRDVRDSYCLARYFSDAQHVPKDSIPEATYFGYPYNLKFQFFHFITDALIPNFAINDTPILLFNNPSDFMISIFDRFDIRKRVVFKTQGIFCNKLRYRSSIGKWDKKLYKNVRMHLKRKQTSPAFRKIYVTREGESRNFANAAQFERFMEISGFEIVDFSKYSLEEREVILSETLVLAGIYGAGLTNMLFMREGSTILDIQPGHWVKEDYQLMAKSCDLNYYSFPTQIKLFGKKNNYYFSEADFLRFKNFLNLIESDM